MPIVVVFEIDDVVVMVFWMGMRQVLTVDEVVHPFVLVAE